jgi:hypothetical protein
MKETTPVFRSTTPSTDLANSRFFSPWTDDDSEVTFLIMSGKVAPLQTGFYFVNDSMSTDGRYLWFYCAFPPSPMRTLAVLDFAEQSVHHFPDTQFTAASPFIDPATGDAYWCAGAGIWRRSPDPSEETTLVNALPSDLVGSRSVGHGATHLTLAADKKAFFVDASIGLQHIFGTLPIDGGDFELWHRFDRNHNHAQMSPTDADAVLFAEETHLDPITGIRIPITNRLWFMRRGEEPRPILRESRWVSHEWWDVDGKHVWCVWGNETWRVNVASGDVEKIHFPHHCWHSHCSHDGALIVGDSNTGFYRGCSSGVHFLNRGTGRSLTLTNNPENHDYSGRNYHIDPHPRFCCGDRYIVFTTTVRGQVDLAVVETEHLLGLTS